VSHYHVQKQRRAKFLEEWRRNRRDVVAVGDVTLHPTPRGSRVGVYVGADGDRPTRTMDALVHEIDPGTTTTIHRHSWDAAVFVVAGWGWTEIDGQRINWGPGDSLHLPAWAWHRSGNDGDTTARYLSFSSEPLLSTMGMSVLEDAGHTPYAELPGRPAFTETADGDDPCQGTVRSPQWRTVDLPTGGQGISPGGQVFSPGGVG